MMELSIGILQNDFASRFGISIGEKLHKYLSHDKTIIKSVLIIRTLITRSKNSSSVFPKNVPKP